MNFINGLQDKFTEILQLADKSTSACYRLEVAGRLAAWESFMFKVLCGQESELDDGYVYCSPAFPISSSSSPTSPTSPTSSSSSATNTTAAPMTQDEMDNGAGMMVNAIANNVLDSAGILPLNQLKLPLESRVVAARWIMRNWDASLSAVSLSLQVC